jgi:hypothetical protein
MGRFGSDGMNCVASVKAGQARDNSQKFYTQQLTFEQVSYCTNEWVVVTFKCDIFHNSKNFESLRLSFTTFQPSNVQTPISEITFER